MSKSEMISEFCESERLSLSFYYDMQSEGWGPDIMQSGTRTTISPEAKAIWRREREEAARRGIRRALPPDVRRAVREEFARQQHMIETV
jgi:hypothetical protein